jgi:hypothetical protein
MNLSSNSFISHNLIVSEIAVKSGDKEFKHDSEGYYTSLVQEALQELSFDTFFLEKEKVYDITEGCLKLELPSGAFNVKQIFGYSGSDCNPDTRRNIYYKRNFKNNISRDNWDNEDPFYKSRRNSNPPGNLYYCGITNGVIHLSSNCSLFQKVVVRFNGLIADIGDIPVIPIYFRQAVVDWAVSEAISVRIANNPHMTKEIGIWQAIMNRYENRLRMPYDGSWDKAMDRVKRMDSKAKEDFTEYIAKLDIG